MTFINVPKDKEHLLSPEQKAELTAYRRGDNQKGNYGNVITREEASVVEKPSQRTRKPNK